MDVDRRRDGLECGVLVADGYELDQLHPVGVAVGDAARQFQAHRRLADTPRTDEGDEAVLPEDGREALEERLAADECLHRSGERRIWRWHRRSVFESGPLERLHGRDELVAPAVDGPDDRLAAAVIPERLAHGLDARRERRLAHETVAPDVIEELLLADDLTPVLDEVAEHVERLRLELHLPTVAAKGDPGHVQLAVGKAKDHRRTAARSAEEDFTTGAPTARRPRSSRARSSWTESSFRGPISWEEPLSRPTLDAYANPTPWVNTVERAKSTADLIGDPGAPMSICSCGTRRSATTRRIRQIERFNSGEVTNGIVGGRPRLPPLPRWPRSASRARATVRLQAGTRTARPRPG